MFINLLLLFSLPEFKPADIQKVYEKFKTINHLKRKYFCSGWKQVRRKAEKTDLYGQLYPVKGLDHNDTGDRYYVLCDHTRCDVNTEFEIVVGALAIKNKHIKLALDDCRPLSIENRHENESSAPHYCSDIRPGCR